MSSLFLLPCLLAGCAVEGDAPSTGVVFDEVAPPGPDDAAEALFVAGEQCQMVFRNLSSPDADIFFIWNLGVGGVLEGEPYPTAERADLFGIFAPAPASAVHHVDGQDQFDHYHVASAGPGQDEYDGTWDVFLVFPGPNFNAATYQAAKSVNDMKRQIRSGVLGPVLKTTDAGFGPLVLNAEIFDCD
jgi:hypothetical protein